ncbi:Fibrinogen-like protein A [Holothuria leucospilota]|uniref:Fibrinogen-like protein A n=1 Tax=Holothuria leucospilota TaxID=206669 RepID=A0A9Q1C620_HOLLE|nr:Fibrinogen-like protein A [Holothuria leucospilota]
MRRLDGSLVFSRNWGEYKEGFGFPSSEFWLGNEKLAYLTNQKRYELRIDMIVSNGSNVFMAYSFFRVKDEWDSYALATLGNATGNTNSLVPTCSINMIYANCTCERTCKAPTICQNNCQEGSTCICPDGFFLRGSDCVPPEECGCYSTTAGKVIPMGESYINNHCSEQCFCNGSGLVCSDYGCGANAQCTNTSEGGQCACNTGFFGDGLECACDTGYMVDGSRCRRPRDCDEVPSVEGYSGSGLYYILPTNWQEFQVYCNISEGRWTVFQRRTPGSGRNFKLSWNSYKTGFGELGEDFWLGNDNIHYLTSQKNYQLRIDMIDSGNRHYRALYNGFSISNEGNKYRITTLGTFSGNAGGNCASMHEGAWWYRHRNRLSSSSACDYYTYGTYYCCQSRSCSSCQSNSYSCAFSNLNGKQSGSQGKTIFWHGLSGNDCGIQYTEMKVRPLS